MTQKEVNELRRRFHPDKSAVSRIYGCYVNGNKEIVSYVDTSLGLLPQEEAEMYLGLLKKALGGALGKNLLDLVFSTQQVQDSDEHRLLSDLRNSRLENQEARDIFYQTVIENLELGENGYLILLASDSYDVPVRNGETDEDRVYTYMVCAICPIKDPSMSLRYFHDDREFHGSSSGQPVGNPALGFLFPAFDNRAANLYNVLYYAQKPAELHRELIDALFRVEAPMSSEEQREAFHNALTQSLAGECGFDLLQTVHEQLRERLTRHKDERQEEPLSLSPREVRDILSSGGVSPERLDAFEYACAEHFGENVVLNPGNVIDSRRFEIVTPEAKISVDPACSYVVEWRVIDGRKYLLIPAGHDVTVNGVPVSTAEDAEDAAESAETLLVGAAPETAEPEDPDTPPWV